jgi:hypothetical protein
MRPTPAGPWSTAARESSSGGWHCAVSTWPAVKRSAPTGFCPESGNGVATAATNRMAAWAFEDLGLHRLTIVHSVANERSCAVATKANFSLEGTLASAQLLVDGWHDVHLHARVNGT